MGIPDPSDKQCDCAHYAAQIEQDSEVMAKAIMSDYSHYDAGDAGHSYRNSGWYCSYCHHGDMKQDRHSVEHSKGCAVLAALRIIENSN